MSPYQTICKTEGHYWYECNVILYSALTIITLQLASGIGSVTLCICKYSLHISSCRKSVPSSPSLCKLKSFFFPSLVYARQHSRFMWNTIIKKTGPWLVTEWAILQIASSWLSLEPSPQVLDLVDAVFKLNVLCK